MSACVNFDKNWLFCLDDREEFKDPSFDDSAWQALDLPHDWSNEYPLDENAPSGGGGGFVRTGVGWYRKTFEIPEKEDGKAYFLRFDGVYMDSTVYLNGGPVGGHGYGYSSFYADLTDAAVTGKNVVSVRVNNALQPNSRWYSGSGIYRSVWFEEKAKLRFDHYGIRCSTNGIYEDEGVAALQIAAAVVNGTEKEQHAGVVHRVYDAEGQLVSTSGIALKLQPGERSDCMTRPNIPAPHLWTDRDPYLYTLESTLLLDGEAVDSFGCRIGIRTATFDKDKGFLLNGKRVKIKGMCVHYDCGLTGAVDYKETWERRLRKLKKMGCNGIRMTVKPPTPYLLDLCDEMGFLCMDEIYDEWTLSKNKNQNYYSEALAYGSAQFFWTDAELDMVTWLRRDFNHPSVVIWNIGNEIPEQSSIDGPKLVRFLQDICHREDQSRMVTSACDNIIAFGNIRTLREFENALDVVGYNYVGRWRERAETFYDEDRREFPERRFIGTENPSAGGTRGVYFPERPGFFRGNYASATLHHEALWRYTESRDFVAGDYFWTGIDYLGETRWPMRGAGSGPLDTAAFEKDTYYYFKSIWNQDEVTLHLAPHWNLPGKEGQYVQVICYTNCDEVQLFINGKPLAKKGYQRLRYGVRRAWNEGFGRRASVSTNDLHLSWDVLYEPGVLRAEGYKDGELAAVTEVETTGRPVKLLAECDRVKTRDAGVVHIDLSTLDEKDRFVPDAAPMVTARAEGAVKLLGLDGGDLSDLTVYGEPERRMFSGRLLAMVKGVSKGTGRVTFTTEDGLTAFVEIEVE